ncbi:hypothetical protein N303_03574, partial [Cuculus canorus]
RAAAFHSLQGASLRAGQKRSWCFRSPAVRIILQRSREFRSHHREQRLF